MAADSAVSTIGAASAAAGKPSFDGAGLFDAVLYVPAGARERTGVRDRVERAGIRRAADLPDALRIVADRAVCLCVLDLAAEQAALAAIRVIRAEHPRMAIAGVVDPARPATTAEALTAGLVETLPWPFADRDLHVAAVNARDRAAGKSSRDRDGAGPSVVAHSEAMRAVMDVVRTVADRHGGVYVSGAPGTGRRFLARTIHHLGATGSECPFVHVDCGGDGLPEIESRLFDCPSRRSEAGRPPGTEELGPESALLAARGGTLYVTNLADAPARVQAKLARVLRDGEASVRGGVVALDVRPITGSTADLDAAVEDGRLRADLYERFAGARVDVPLLRDRREDIPALAVEFARDACRASGAEAKTFSRAVLQLMAALPWHGNAGELRTLVGTLVRAVRRPVIQLDDLLSHASLDGMATRLDAGLTLREAKAKFERECISAALRQHHGRVGDAARALGIQRTNLYRKVRQLNVARSLLSARK